MQQPKIEFRKDRDFGSVLGDALKFLKQNFSSLFGSIVLIIGPLILVTGVAYGYMQSTIMHSSYQLTSTNPLEAMASQFTGTYFIAIGVLMVCGLFVSVLLNSVVFNYMGIYSEKPFGEKITVSEVGTRVWSNFGRVIASMLVFTLVMAVVFVIIALLVALIVTGTGIAGGVIIGLLIFFALLFFTPILVYFIPAAFYVVVRDGDFIFKALGKVRKYMSGSFWWTWLIMVVALIGLGILQIIFNLPASIITISQTFMRLRHINDGSELMDGPSVWLIVFYTIGMFLTTCSSSILHLICAFNFLGHEEKHEGKGLASRMDEIK